MSAIDWRGLCEELSDESVEAAAQVIYGSMRFDRVDSTSDWVPNGNSFAQDEARRCAHAVLARFGGRPAQVPVGEVAELVVVLHEAAMEASAQGRHEAFAQFHRAADLLEQRQAAPVPVLPEDAQVIEPTERTILVPAPVPVAVSGWQPISTAPKDGTEILASDYDAIEIVSWKVYEADSDWESRWGEVMFPAWWQPLADHPPLLAEEVE